MPLFSKLHCNGGGCHGKQSGQNGFKLSVFGFDPREDYNALVKQARGRRLFPAAAAKSLLVTKPAGLVPHGGGQRMQPGSLDHELLVRWIEQGAPWGPDDAPQLASIVIQPADRIMAMQRDQQILVTAKFSNGSQRDVTSAASYTSNAELLASVDADGRLHTGRIPGEAAITVNYRGHVGAVRVLIPRPADSQPYPQIPTHNRIDELVWAKLRKLNIIPSETCDDATFLRRLMVDRDRHTAYTCGSRTFFAKQRSQQAQPHDRPSFTAARIRGLLGVAVRGHFAGEP